MSHSYYSEINLHLVWHTKDNQPQLTPEVEAAAHRFIRDKARSVRGVFFHEVGGIEDHVHVVISILPTVLISNLIGELKGYSSHEVNVVVGRGQKVLVWQTGYGVVSFGTRHLDWVLRYVRNQKEHHANKRTRLRLERTDSEEEEAPSSP